MWKQDRNQCLHHEKWLRDRGENAGIAAADSDRDTNAATADSGENEVRSEEEEYEGM